MSKPKDLAVNFIRGFCMALADSVPGVSGGTVAFILGFYERFVTSLDDLARGDRSQRLDAVRFLIKIGVGWVIGFAVSAFVLTSLFEAHIYAISSLFLGFIVFAIPLIVREEKEAVWGKWRYVPFILLGIAAVIAASVASPASESGIDVAIGQLSPGLGIFIFISAMVAISAMVLPGISGSTLMLIFGLYIPMMGAVKGVLSLDFSYLPAVLIFIGGAVTGIILFVRLIRMCLDRFRSQSIFAILGMMIGSVYPIAQGPLTLAVPQDPLSLATFNLAFFIIGGAIVIGLQLLKNVMDAPREGA